MYNSLIIGAGAIAGGYDTPDDECILTHAHAYNLNPHVNLKGFYDIDFERSEKMAEKWNTKAFKNLDEIRDIDIISICTPDNLHFSSIQTILNLNPKVIFLEKPIGVKLDEAQKIIKIAQDIPIQVNFSRRFVKEFQDLSKNIKAGFYGKFLTGTGYYGKGFIHNGSHMLDLLNLLIGEVRTIQTITSFNDFFENDLTKSVVLDFENGAKFFMQGVDCKSYTIFETDLFFEKARIRIINSGYNVEIYLVKESEKFKGYKNIILDKTFSTELDFAMKNAVSNIVNFLEKEEDLYSKPMLLPVYKEFEND